MTTRNLSRIFLLISVFGLHSGFAAPLKTAAQENAPKFMKSPNKAMTGICIDIMKALQRVDPEISFMGQEDFVPIKRIEQDLKDGKIDLFFGFAKTKEKLEQYRYVDIPLYSVRKVLAARADDPVAISSWDEVNALDDRVVLAIAGTASAEQAQAAGAMVDGGASTPEANLAKLVSGRGRFYFHTDIAILQAARNAGLESKIRILSHVFSEEGQYLVFSKRVPEDIVQRVERALGMLKKSGELARIFSSYVTY